MFDLSRVAVLGLVCGPRACKALLRSACVVGVIWWVVRVYYSNINLKPDTSCNSHD